MSLSLTVVPPILNRREAQPYLKKNERQFRIVRRYGVAVDFHWSEMSCSHQRIHADLASDMRFWEYSRVALPSNRQSIPEKRAERMKAVKAIYSNGQIKFEELPMDPGPTEELVVFPESADDPWAEILMDSSDRPALTQRLKELEQEIAQGKTSALDLSQL